MKRPRIYMPRTGIRFARSDAGPPGGFIGGDVQVTAVTGSVGKYLQQNSGIFRFPSVPFTGYPRTADEMSLATGKAWTDGFLFDEISGSLVSSFNNGNLFVGPIEIHPTSSAELNSASGLGTPWNAIYVLNQSGGNVSSSIGSLTLDRVGTPTYSNIGPFPGTRAIGFDSVNDQFSGGDNFDITSTDDLIVLWIAKVTSAVGTQVLFTKGNSGPARWVVYSQGEQLKIEVESASGIYSSSLDVSGVLNKWHAGMAVISRTGPEDRVAIGVKAIGDLTTIDSVYTPIPAETLGNSDSFTFGGRNGAEAAVGWQFSFAAIRVGANIASGLAFGPGGYTTTFVNYLNSHVRYQQHGFRSSNTGDHAITFNGQLTYNYGSGVTFSANNQFAKLSATGDIMFAFVAKMNSTENLYGEILWGGDLHFGINSDSIITGFDAHGGIPGSVLTESCTLGNWFTSVVAIERIDATNIKSRIVTKDLITGEIKISSIVSSSLSAGDQHGGHYFGGNPLGFPTPSKFSMSALYISSGSLPGITEDSYLVGAVNGLYNVLNASNTFKLTGSTDIDNSISSFGNYHETALLNARLLNAGSGGLGYTYRSIVTPSSSYSPSWSNSHLGSNSAFVMQILSSSNHEVTNLNLYRSGSEPLETTAVPASASLYYSKKSSLNKITVKKTASYFDTIETSGSYFPETFTAGLGSKLNTVGGGGFAGMASERISPASIFLNVPVTGKLVDVKVWLELHHVSGSAGGLPLGCLGVALRSPNLRWGMSHPLLNRDDPTVAETFLGQPQEFWTNSFILWEGLGVSVYDQRSYDPDGEHIPSSVFREKYAGWDRDLGMRTIFCDGAEVNNPRHNLGIPASQNYTGSPNEALGINSAWGMGVDWTGSAGGAPPAGWLTGPGATAAQNEWPTYGINRGANFLKPLYPLLDLIEVRIAPQTPGITYPEQFFGQKVFPEKIVGTRPGLRGTEISGSWELMFAYSLDDDNAADPPGLYFRQARLEITYEEHEDTSYRRGNSTSTPVRPGPKQVWEISGTQLSSVVTASNYVNVIVTNESSIGRTFGLALNTGTINFSDSALIYRLTGSLADISGSAPGWLTNNRFGMPMIPISSASLANNDEDASIIVNPQQLVTTRPLLDGPRRLRDAANDASPKKTRARYAAGVISGSLT